MAPFNGQTTRGQQVFLALTPKITGFLSLLGSCYIIHDCLVRTPRERRHTYHRLLVGLSVADIIMTSGLFLSTWPMPADTQNVAFAVGNVHTCAAVGFLETAGTIAVLYNASLSVYYVLRIKAGWTPSQIKRVEPYIHGVPIVFGFSTMIAGISLKLFNAGLWDCWIYPHPHGCLESWRNNGTTDCVRGDNASLYQWVFDVIPKWLSILVVTWNMVRIHQSVWRKEQASQRFSMRNTHLAKQLARQSYLYVGALYLTYIPVVMTRMTEVLTGSVYYGMIVTISITIPLQGFWNLMVFLRPRYLQSIQRRQQDSGSSGSFAFLGMVRLRAVSQAVKEGALDDEMEEEGDSTVRASKAEQQETQESATGDHIDVKREPQQQIPNE